MNYQDTTDLQVGFLKGYLKSQVETKQAIITLMQQFELDDRPVANEIILALAKLSEQMDDDRNKMLAA